MATELSTESGALTSKVPTTVSTLAEQTSGTSEVQVSTLKDLDITVVTEMSTEKALKTDEAAVSQSSETSDTFTSELTTMEKPETKYSVSPTLPSTLVESSAATQEISSQDVTQLDVSTAFSSETEVGVSFESHTTPKDVVTETSLKPEVILTTVHPVKPDDYTTIQKTATSADLSLLSEESSLPSEKTGFTYSSVAQRISHTTVPTFSQMPSEPTTKDAIKVIKTVSDTLAATTEESTSDTSLPFRKTTTKPTTVEKESTLTESEPQIIPENATGKPLQIDSMLKDTTTGSPSLSVVSTKTSAPSDRRIIEEKGNVTMQVLDLHSTAITDVPKDSTTAESVPRIPAVLGIDHETLVTGTESSSSASSPELKVTIPYDITQPPYAEITNKTTDKDSRTDFPTGSFTTKTTTEHLEFEYVSGKVSLFTETPRGTLSTKKVSTDLTVEVETVGYTQTAFDISTKGEEAQEFFTSLQPEYETVKSNTTGSEFKEITIEGPVHSITESDVTDTAALAIESKYPTSPEKISSTGISGSTEETEEVTLSSVKTDIPISTEVSISAETIESKETEQTPSHESVTRKTEHPTSDAYPGDTESVSTESFDTSAGESVMISTLEDDEILSSEPSVSTVARPGIIESTSVTEEGYPKFTVSTNDSFVSKHATTISTATPIVKYVTSRVRSTTVYDEVSQDEALGTTKRATGGFTATSLGDTDFTESSDTIYTESSTKRAFTKPSDYDFASTTTSGEAQTEPDDNTTITTDAREFVSTVSEMTHVETKEPSSTIGETFEVYTPSTKKEIIASTISPSDVTFTTAEILASSEIIFTRTKESSPSSDHSYATGEMLISTSAPDVTQKHETTTISPDAISTEENKTLSTLSETLTGTQKEMLITKTTSSVSEEEETFATSATSIVSVEEEYFSTTPSREPASKEFETQPTSIPVQTKLTEETVTKTTEEADATMSTGIRSTGAKTDTMEEKRIFPSTSAPTEIHITKETEITPAAEVFTHSKESPSTVPDVTEVIPESKLFLPGTHGIEYTESTKLEEKVTLAVTLPSISTERSVTETEHDIDSTSDGSETSIPTISEVEKTQAASEATPVAPGATTNDTGASIVTIRTPEVTEKIQFVSTTSPTTYYEEDITTKQFKSTSLASLDETQTETIASGLTETLSTERDAVEENGTISTSLATVSDKIGVTDEQKTAPTTPQVATESDSTVSPTLSVSAAEKEASSETVSMTTTGVTEVKKIDAAATASSTSETDQAETDGLLITTPAKIDLDDSARASTTEMTGEEIFTATELSTTKLSTDSDAATGLISVVPKIRESVSPHDLASISDSSGTTGTETAIKFTKTTDILTGPTTEEVVSLTTPSEPLLEFENQTEIVLSDAEISIIVTEAITSPKSDVTYEKPRTETLSADDHETMSTSLHSESTMSEPTVTTVTEERKKTERTHPTVTSTDETATSAGTYTSSVKLETEPIKDGSTLLSFDLEQSKSTTTVVDETIDLEQLTATTEHEEDYSALTAISSSDTPHASPTALTQSEETDKSESSLAPDTVEQSHTDGITVWSSTAPTERYLPTEAYSTPTAVADTDSTVEDIYSTLSKSGTSKGTTPSSEELSTSSNTSPTPSEKSTELTHSYTKATYTAQTDVETERILGITVETGEDSVTPLDKFFTSTASSADIRHDTETTASSAGSTTLPDIRLDTESSTSTAEHTRPTTSRITVATSPTSRIEEETSVTSRTEDAASTSQRADRTETVTSRAEDTTTTITVEASRSSTSIAEDVASISTRTEDTESSTTTAKPTTTAASRAEDTTTITSRAGDTTDDSSRDKMTITSPMEDLTKATSSIEDITPVTSSYEDTKSPQAVTVSQVTLTTTTVKDTNFTTVPSVTEEEISLSTISSKGVPTIKQATQTDSDIFTLHDVKISTTAGSTDFIFTSGSSSAISTLKEKLSTSKYTSTPAEKTTTVTESTTPRSTIQELFETLSTLFIPTRNATMGPTSTGLPSTTEKAESPESTEPPYIPSEEGYCFFDGQIYQSAEQIPRSDPCEFCFCFRGDIICLQQTCPPPIRGCYATPIEGFCCPRFQCPVHATRMNVTTTTTTTTTTQRPKFGGPLSQKTISVTGCEIDGNFYRIGQVVRAASGPCIECRCEFSGMMKCNPQDCEPQAPLLLRMNKEFFRRKR